MDLVSYRFRLVERCVSRSESRSSTWRNYTSVCRISVNSYLFTLNLGLPLTLTLLNRSVNVIFRPYRRKSTVIIRYFPTSVKLVARCTVARFACHRPNQINLKSSQKLLHTHLYDVYMTPRVFIYIFYIFLYIKI